MKIKKVCVVGGTHGNEYTGVYLLKKWQDNKALMKKYRFETRLLLANEKAFLNNRRYMENDLNRCFTDALLNDDSSTSYEELRAKEINQELGPKGNSKTDFIIDLHTSTANMGINLVVTNLDQFHLQMLKYAEKHLDNVVFTSEDKLMADHHFLCNISECSVLVEVGPIPQGLLRQDVFDKTEKALQVLLDFVQEYNSENFKFEKGELEIYRYFDVMTMPLTEQGELAGMVHENLQGQDFKQVKPGDPIFQLFNGDVEHYAGDRPVYLSFINEAAYYDKQLAFALLDKEVIKLQVPELTE